MSAPAPPASRPRSSREDAIRPCPSCCSKARRKPGAKILVSGGSRCNLTNTVVTEHDFWGGRSTIVRRVLRAFPVPETIAFFRELGVHVHEEAGGKLFPDSNRARDVLDALLGATRSRRRHAAHGSTGARHRRRPATAFSSRPAAAVFMRGQSCSRPAASPFPRAEATAPASRSPAVSVTPSCRQRPRSCRSSSEGTSSCADSPGSRRTSS